MRGIDIARDLAALKRDRTSRFRERVNLSYGRYKLCESKGEYQWWEGFTQALEKGQIKPHEFSVRDLFEHLVPHGRELVNAFNPSYGPDAGNRELREAAGAVTSSDFSSITGQIVYSRMIESLTPEDTVFQNLLPTQSTRFSGERIPGITGLGDSAEVVAENENYPLVGVGEDYIDTPATTKRGFIVPVTKEAIFFDRTGMLLQKAGAVGESLRLNKEKRAIDCLIDENTTAHRYKWKGTTYASYQTTSPWDNTTASNSLVDWTDIDNAIQTLNGILDPHTGEPVMVSGDTIIVCESLLQTANRIVNATEIHVHSGGYATSGNLTETRAPNPYKGAFKVATSRLLAARLATDTHWFFGRPSKYAVYMENWPITVSQSPAGDPDDFNKDIVVKYKCSERGQYAVLEPRVMTNNT